LTGDRANRRGAGILFDIIAFIKYKISSIRPKKGGEGMSASEQPNGLIINYSGKPFLPPGFVDGRFPEDDMRIPMKGPTTLEKRNGKLFVNDREVSIYLSANQRAGRVIRREKLWQELRHRETIDSCIMDTLLEHPYLIPEDWDGKHIYFWGTILHDEDRGSATHGDFCVRYMFRDVGGRWKWSYGWFNYDAGRIHPAAYFA
jgi:hypothetical protein